jgi:hypothetical protein
VRGADPARAFRVRGFHDFPEVRPSPEERMSGADLPDLNPALSWWTCLVGW